MCTNNFGQAELSSILANNKALPQRPNAGGLVPGYKQVVTKVSDNVVNCEFCRTFDVPSESRMFMYNLNENLHAVYAAGFLDGSVEAYHGFGPMNRDFTAVKMDFRRFVVSFLHCYFQ